MDASGDLFIADSGNNVVREVTNGNITTVAGDGTAGDSGDGGAAVDAELNDPTWVAASASGDLFIADSNNYVIREVTPGGIISTVAGNAYYGFSGDGGPATGASLSNPAGVAVDDEGDLFIADQGNNVVREVASGMITTVAGNGSGLANSSGVAVDPQSDLFFADGNDVQEVTPGGIITPVATGLAPYDGPYGGISGLAVYTNGDLLIADALYNRILEVTPNGIVTVAGNGSSGYSGDGGLATAASLNVPTGLAVDAQGDLYIADQGNNVVREVTPGPDGLLSDGIITTVVSGMHAGWDDGPGGLALDSRGDLFIADTGVPEVWEKTPGPDGLLADGTLTTVVAATVFNGGDSPSGLAVDAQGDLFIEGVGQDGVDELVEVLPNGSTTVVASFPSSVYWDNNAGLPYFYDSGGSPVSFQGLAIDPQGDFLVAEGQGIGVIGDPSLTVLASPASTIATTTTVASSASTSVAGQAVTFTATVVPQGTGGLPTGTVIFMDGNTALDTESLSGGVASFTTSSLGVGSHPITAIYSGDANYVTSTSVR